MTQAEMKALGVQAEQAIAGSDYPSAIALYERIVTVYPKSAPAWFRLGTVYLRTSQPELAQRAFEQALRADPNLSKAHANLALAHLTQFRAAATRAVAGDQISEANREALKSLLRDVDHALFPAASLPPAITQ
jgi:predicted TPR repeat methyltransferase